MRTLLSKFSPLLGMIIFLLVQLIIPSPVLAVPTKPNLTATKTNNLAGGHAIVGSSFNWTIHVANSGTDNATFNRNEVILTDNLPSGPSYGTPSVTTSGTTGTGSISCAIVSNDLNCTAIGATGSDKVRLPNPSSFDVQFSVTPNSTTTLNNPRSGGICTVDPGTGHISESDETDNNCSNGPIFVDAADSTPPVITPNIIGALGNNGWYVSNVSVSWTVTDPESSISSSTGCGTTNITSDTTGTTLTCTATSAGGTSSNSVTIKRDATAPIITLNTPTNGAHYVRFDNVLAVWSINAAISGLFSSSATTPNGSPIDTSTAGSKPFSITATDNAGNTASINISYVVDLFPSECASLAPFARTIIGTNGNDNLAGLSGGSNLIFGRGGDDQITPGSGGGNCIVGGDGNDTLTGGSSNDVLLGGNGNDTISGGAGGDRLYGGAGDDVIDGGSGNDFIDGGTGIDNVTGGSGTDTCLAETRLACEL